ncbi:hypothetical protein [Portibacter marinus]|uniref:hypothetical protein n=1 Tax=Portibacter marinus TaxID=2898660 RepID=UPI001F1710BF|nr:hypothetical protein [Portibacter marinus]
MRYGLYIICLIFLTSCATQESATKGVGYFDLETYIKDLSEEVKNQQNVRKTVTLNGVTETKNIGTYTITPELNMMNKYNINKPALAGKYEENKQGSQTVYTAKEDDLITRKLTVETKNNEVTRIEIDGLQKTILSESKQTIVFVPKASFLLKSEDLNRFTKDITKEVLIEY